VSSPLWQIELELRQGAFRLALELRSEARVLGLFGPSGSGKTSCLESIAGLRPGARGLLACEGRVLLDSPHGIRLRPEDRGLGYLPQDHLLFPHLDAAENLRFGLRRARGDSARFDEVVEVLELGELLRNRPDQLSGGQRQRVALGRALCSGPRLLLLDEPLASLDAALRHRILPFLLRVRDHFRIPMLVVSHNPVELQALCEEVAVLEDGRLRAQGSPMAVLTRSDTYGTASAEGFETILPAALDPKRPHRARLGEDGSGPELILVGDTGTTARSVRLGIPARDLLIALEPVAGISARNQLPATLVGIHPVGGRLLALARLDGSELPPLAVELTPDAVEDLQLRPGRSVRLIVKSSAIRIYG